MAKSIKNSRKSKPTRKEIEEAAEIASNEAVEELGLDTREDDVDDMSFAGGLLAEPDESYAEDDVFEESFKKAVALNTAPKFYIKKNSQFLCVKGWPYSWERLQAEYGEGYYQVIAKCQNNGRILRRQSEMVGDPSGGTAQHEEVEESAPSDSNLAYLTMMQQFQERADVKAQAQAKTGESALAAVMQTVMQSQQQMTQLMLQSQQESARQFQTLVTSLLSQQQNKAPDPMLTLVTTLLTQKPKDDNGFTTASVLKMIQDAESRAETRANKIQEQIEKKADSLAEMKVQAMEAGEGEAEESGLKGLIKGFVPVITQMIANNQAAQPTPAQIAQMQEQRRLHGGSSALDQGFIDEQANRPMVGAPRQRPAPRPIVRPVETEVPQSVTSPAVPSGVVVSNPGVSGPVKSEIQSPAQEMVLSSRQKREIFDACAGDIGRALMDRVSASKTAQLIVDKLEKEGLSRQTVAKAYVVEDFYGYAQEYGLPDEVKPWLKEFHESLQKMAGPVVVRESSSAIAPAKVVVANGHLPEKPVPAKRATEARPRARTQPRGHSKDL